MKVSSESFGLTPMAQVFISYAHENRNYAERVADRLKAAGLNPWWDEEDLILGDVWNPKLDQAIKQSFAMVVIVTKYAFESHWVTYEWAVESILGITVIPLILEHVELKSVK